MAKVKGNALAQSTSIGAKPEAPKDDYEAQGHLQDLIRAHEIVNNPEKMAKVHKLAGRHHKAIKSIQDIKDAYNTKFGPKAGLNQMKDPTEPDADDK